MIERIAMFGHPAAARPHVKAMSDEAGLKRCPGHATDVTGTSVSLEAVNQHHFSDWTNQWALRLDENLCIRVGTNEAVLFGKARKIEVPGPEIAEDRQNVWIVQN